MKAIALAFLALTACGPVPCEEWRETAWRAPAVETCTGVITKRGGAIVIAGVDDLLACPDARSCSMLTPGRDESATRYYRTDDGAPEPVLLFGVDCNANTCEEIEMSSLGSEP